MSSIVTGGLAGLVVVLAVALWRKEQTQGHGVPQRGAKQQVGAGDGVRTSKSKTKKNKKKGGSVQAKAGNGEVVQQDEKAAQEAQEMREARRPVGVADKDIAQVGTAPSAPSAQKSSKKKKKSGNASNGGPGAPPKEESVPAVQSNSSLQLPEPASAPVPSVDVSTAPLNGTNEGVIDFSDFEIVDELPRRDDGGWQNVGGKTRLPASAAVATKAKTNVPANAWASSNPFAALPDGSAESSPSRVLSLALTNTSKTSAGYTGSGSSTARPSAASSDSAPSKRQRQNAARTQAKKADKEAQEAERLARLAQHKRQLESERARAGDRKGNGRPQPYSVPGPGAGTAAKASINDKGALVWE